ncbi:hypothetical protein LZ31DRAFT_549876 [Colletotrichum somersetense]|nr:hypothetical protein LZ31DRAFT_549876 [Colletotrichum somersetense]
MPRHQPGLFLFLITEVASLRLAACRLHRVPGISLPPGDANRGFHCQLWLVQGGEEDLICSKVFSVSCA